MSILGEGNTKSLRDELRAELLRNQEPILDAAAKIATFASRMDVVEGIAADVSTRADTFDASMLLVQSDIDRLDSLTFDVRNYLSDVTGATDMRWEFINMLGDLPEGATLMIPAGVKISSSGYIPIDKSIRIAGLGWIDWTGNGDTSSARGGFIVFADNVTIEGVRLTNMSGNGSLTNGPMRAIQVEGSNVTIENCWIDNWFTGVRQAVKNVADAESRGFVCRNNFLTNIFGLAFTNGASVQDAEGDGIMIAAMDSVVTGNVVRAKIGSACRCGIGVDGVGNEPPAVYSNSVQVNDTAITISNNVVEGPWTRAIHVEESHNVIVTSNVAYGFLWWGVVVWNATDVIVSNNNIVFTSKSTTPQPAIFTYAPYRCGIMGLVENTASISGNTIKLHTDTNWDSGIVLMSYGVAGTTSYSVTDNRISCSTKNASGIFVTGATGVNTIIRSNTIEGGAERGVDIASSSTATVQVVSNSITASVVLIRSTSCKRLIADYNNLFGANTTVSSGLVASAGELLLARHNTFMDLNKGINATGVTASYAPGSAFVNVVSTKVTGVTSTTAYGPA